MCSHERAHSRCLERITRDAVYPRVTDFVGHHWQLRAHFVHNRKKIVEG
jgi:hypothetical protein